MICVKMFAKDLFKKIDCCLSLISVDRCVLTTAGVFRRDTNFELIIKDSSVWIAVKQCFNKFSFDFMTAIKLMAVIRVSVKAVLFAGQWYCPIGWNGLRRHCCCRPFL